MLASVCLADVKQNGNPLRIGWRLLLKAWWQKAAAIGKDAPSDLMSTGQLKAALGSSFPLVAHVQQH